MGTGPTRRSPSSHGRMSPNGSDSGSFRRNPQVPHSPSSQASCDAGEQRSVMHTSPQQRHGVAGAVAPSKTPPMVVENAVHSQSQTARLGLNPSGNPSGILNGNARVNPSLTRSTPPSTPPTSPGRAQGIAAVGVPADGSMAGAGRRNGSLAQPSAAESHHHTAADTVPLSPPLQGTAPTTHTPDDVVPALGTAAFLAQLEKTTITPHARPSQQSLASMHTSQQGDGKMPVSQHGIASMHANVMASATAAALASTSASASRSGSLDATNTGNDESNTLESNARAAVAGLASTSASRSGSVDASSAGSHPNGVHRTKPVTTSTVPASVSRSAGGSGLQTSVTADGGGAALAGRSCALHKSANVTTPTTALASTEAVSNGGRQSISTPAPGAQRTCSSLV